MNKFAEQFNHDVMVRYQQKLAALNVEMEKDAGIADVVAKAAKKEIPLDIFSFNKAVFNNMFDPNKAAPLFPQSFKDVFKTVAAPISGMGGVLISALDTPVTFAKDVGSGLSKMLFGNSNNKVMQKLKSVADTNVMNLEKLIPDAHAFVELGMPENMPGKLLYNGSQVLTSYLPFALAAAAL